MLAVGVRGAGCDRPRRQQRGAQTRSDELQRGELHARRREESRRIGHRPQRGRLDDPEGPVRPDRHHHDRSSLLPHPSRAAEEARPEEEVRSAGKLRRLRGDGGCGERRRRHAVRSSEPPQMNPAARRLRRLHLLMDQTVHRRRGCQLILIMD